MNFTHMPELNQLWAHPAISCLAACVVGIIVMALK